MTRRPFTRAATSFQMLRLGQGLTAHAHDKVSMFTLVSLLSDGGVCNNYFALYKRSLSHSAGQFVCFDVQVEGTLSEPFLPFCFACF